MTIDTDKLKALALAAEKNGEHIYTHPRDSNKWKDNEAWHRAASPEAFSELIAERDELRAEVERLRADAERYRWLRDKARDSDLDVAPVVVMMDVFGKVIDDNRELDFAIDEAIEKEKA